jgi:hypothetical protein
MGVFFPPTSERVTCLFLRNADFLKEQEHSPLHTAALSIEHMWLNNVALEEIYSGKFRSCPASMIPSVLHIFLLFVLQRRYDLAAIRSIDWCFHTFLFL